jgi:methyl-accepting chemotaxis protein
MNHLRLRTKLGLIVGILVGCVMAVAVVGYRGLGRVSRELQDLVQVTAKMTMLASDLRDGVALTRRTQFRAVITHDDAQSQEFARRTRDTAKQMDAAYAELSASLDRQEYPDERKLLDGFHQAWDSYRETLEACLSLCLENTNVKAHQLSMGELSSKIREIDEAAGAWLRQLDRVLSEPPDTPDADNGRRAIAARIRPAVSRVQVIALDVHRQTNQHIFDTTDEAMDRLEEQIAMHSKEMEARLAELAAHVDDQDQQRLDALSASWRAVAIHLAQMRKWLRADSNDRSSRLAESSNDHVDACMTALVMLQDKLRDRMLNTLSSVQTTTHWSQWLMLLVPLVGIAVSTVLACLLTRSIVEPITQGVALSEAIAQGDLTGRMNLAQRDEVGMVAGAMDRIAAAFGNVVGEIRGVSRNIGGSASELSSVSHQVLAQSEQMTAQAGQVASSTEQMATNITTMAAAAEEMSMNVASISSASEQISVNVGTISAAAEATARNVTTVAAALQESAQAFEAISHDARDGSQVADRAMGMADGAGNTMKELERSAADIGKVTEAIKMIAMQTNLLALNATIEATSAGEAGKGFAVVAHEIKELANQSARAAEDIARKIEGVQSSTRDAVSVIHEVQEIIHALNASSTRISESIDRQSLSAKTSTANLAEASQGVQHIARSIAEVAKGANDMSRNAGEAATAANDMSRNASEAAHAVGDISANIHSVSQATRDNTASAQSVNTAAQRLAAIATQLEQLVEPFRI